MLKKIYKKFNISEKLLDFEKEIEKKIEARFKKIEEISRYNQMKVLEAFQTFQVGEDDFYSKTGYGFSDIGREKIEKIYAKVFNTEDALVRPIIVSGTHALTLMLTGLLFPGDEFISIAGKPYDTLDEVIGLRGEYPGSLLSIGVKYDQVDLTEEGKFDEGSILEKISSKTKVVYIQRSSGYEWRKSLEISDFKEIIGKIKDKFPEIIIMVDNCYGEFIEIKEPTDVGADVMAGSLIKNPGGGLAITGGYIVGKEKLISLISNRLTAPGIGKEQGLMFNQSRLMMQGFFIAPHIVSQALKGAIFCAKAYEELGYSVNPNFDDKRSDIIQGVKLEKEDRLIKFCQGVQESAPIDSYVKLSPWDMPGYSSKVIMAAGAFVQGSSIELSADGPIKEPYIAYFQGGLTYQYSKIGVLKSISKIMEGEFNE